MVDKRLAGKTIQINVSQRVAAELEKLPKWRAMMALQGRSFVSAYDLAKELKWSTGKTHAVLRGLEEGGAIESKKTLASGRAVKLVRLKE